MKKIFLAFALMLASSLAAMALDKPKIKWGKPTQEELEMTTYDKNPEADAVVLHKETSVRIDYKYEGFKLEKFVKCRIKVLKPKGKDWANGEIVYRYNGGTPGARETLNGLKAASYNLVDGKVVKTQMEKSMIFNEDASKRYRLTKFTVPQVQEGTVIEYEYNLSSDFFFSIDDWEAQSKIPVVYTYYSVTIPEYFKFNCQQTGFCALQSDRSEQTMTLSLKSGTATISSGVFEFAGRDLPMIRKEPMCINPFNYGTKVSIELSGISIPGQVYKSYAQTWEDIDRQLMEDDDFGKRISKNPLKDEMEAQGIKNIADPVEKIAQTYRLLKSKVRWNEKYALFTSDKPSKVLKDGTGNNADMNFMLINMLRDAGVDCYPAVLSRRSDGLLAVARPSMNKLSTMIVAIPQGDTYIYMDCSAELGWVDVLPSDLLSNQVRIIFGEGNATWVNLFTHSQEKDVFYITSKLNPDGTIEGKRLEKYQGLGALNHRLAFKHAKDSTEYIRDIERNDNLEVRSYKATGMTEFGPTAQEEFEFTAQTEVAGDLIYVKPFVDTFMAQSPFTDEKRDMPIEMPSASSILLTSIIYIPEGYEIDEMPQDKGFRTDDGQMTCRMAYVQSEGMVTSTLRFTVSDVLFAPERYASIKGFYDEIAKANGEMLVLKKK